MFIPRFYLVRHRYPHARTHRHATPGTIRVPVYGSSSLWSIKPRDSHSPTELFPLGLEDAQKPRASSWLLCFLLSHLHPMALKWNDSSSLYAAILQMRAERGQAREGTFPGYLA